MNKQPKATEKDLLLKQDKIIADQDQIIDQINIEIGTLKQIGTSMGTSIDEHNVALNGLNSDVYNANSRLNHTTGRIQKLINVTNSSHCYIIAILLVIIIILIVIYFSV